MISKLYFTLEDFETSDDNYDLPLEGFADYSGQPHFIKLHDDPLNTSNKSIYGLTPISPQLFSRVVELAATFHDWELAYHAGKIALSTHPLQSGNNNGYKDSLAFIQAEVSTFEPQYFRTAVFTTSSSWLNEMSQFVCKTWPNPGWYSRDIEIAWSDS
jgi:hypothetical protein